MDGTEALAGPATSATVAPQTAAPIEPTATPSTGAVAAAPAPAAYQAPPREAMPHREGMVGILDAIGDFLSGGGTQQKIAYDENGKHTTETPMTTGQKIAKIGLTALTGAARGMAAPPGPSHVSQGIAAGTLGAIGDQEYAADKLDATAQQAFQQKQKAKIDGINYQLGVRNLATTALTLKALGVKAVQDQIESSNKMIDRERTLESYDLGMAANKGEIADVISKLPGWEQELYKHENVQAIPVYAADGTSNGLQLYLRKPNTDTQPIAPDEKVRKFMPPSKPGDEPTYAYYTPAQGTQRGEADKYNRAADTQFLTWQKDQAEAVLKKQQAATQGTEQTKNNATASEAPSVINKNNAEAAKALADAAKARRETTILAINGSDSATQGMNHDQIVDGMLHGAIDITKAVGIFKDPHARETYIADAIRKDPSWTMAKYQTMLKMREDATTGKMGDQVQSFQTFTGHAGGLVDSIQELRNTGSPWLNVPINKIKRGAAGSAALANVMPKIEAVRNEFQNFLANHALQKDEIARGEKMLDENQSPAAMQAAVKSFETVALTRLGAVNYRYKSTIGRDFPGLLDPHTQQVIERMGLGGYAGTTLHLDEPQQAAPAAQPAAQGFNWGAHPVAQ